MKRTMLGLAAVLPLLAASPASGAGGLAGARQYEIFKPRYGRKFYVVLGSYHMNLPGEQRRMDDLVACLGYDSGYVPSSFFKGFVPGYEIMVWGAFDTRVQASRALAVARRCASDAYIRMGEWIGD